MATSENSGCVIRLKNLDQVDDVHRRLERIKSTAEMLWATRAEDVSDGSINTVAFHMYEDARDVLRAIRDGDDNDPCEAKVLADADNNGAGARLLTEPDDDEREVIIHDGKRYRLLSNAVDGEGVEDVVTAAFDLVQVLYDQSEDFEGTSLFGLVHALKAQVEALYRAITWVPGEVSEAIATKVGYGDAA